MNLTCVPDGLDILPAVADATPYAMGILDAHLSLCICDSLSRLQRSLRAVARDTQFANRETANFRRRRESACLRNPKRHDVEPGPGLVDLSPSDRHLLQPPHRRYVHCGSLLLALVTSCPVTQQRAASSTRCANS